MFLIEVKVVRDSKKWFGPTKSKTIAHLLYLIDTRDKSLIRLTTTNIGDLNSIHPDLFTSRQEIFLLTPNYRLQINSSAHIYSTNVEAILREWNEKN